MKNISLLAMFCATLSVSTVGHADPNMPIIHTWNGPFGGTKISKLFDQSEGVVCYVYSPASVTWQWGSGGVKQYVGNHVGSISCVKVLKTQRRKK